MFLYFVLFTWKILEVNVIYTLSPLPLVTHDGKTCCDWNSQKKQSTFCRASALPDGPSDCGCLCQGKSILHQLMLAKHWTVKFSSCGMKINQKTVVAELICASILEMCSQSSCWKSFLHFELIHACTSTPEILKTAAYKPRHIQAQFKALKSFTFIMRLTQKNLIWFSQAETIVSYNKLLLSLSNYEIIIVSNIIYSLFTLNLLQSFFSSGNAHF